MLMFGFVQAMFTVDCSTRCDGGSFFLREPNNFLSGFRRALRSGFDELPPGNSCPDNRGRSGKGKRQNNKRRTKERVCQLVRLRSLSEEEKTQEWQRVIQ